jgi:hypothetical protein
LALDFVDDHQSAEFPEGEHRLGQSALADRIFQVKILRACCASDLPGERGFAALSRAVKHDHRARAKSLVNSAKQCSALNHP